jgi:hypothetical protein
MRFWKNPQFPQGLKPATLLALDGAAKAAPLQRNIYETGLRPCRQLFQGPQAANCLRQIALLKQADRGYSGRSRRKA